MPFLKYVLQLKKEFNYNGLLHWYEEKTNGESTKVLTKNNWGLDGVLNESLDDRSVRTLTERKNLAKRNPNERVGIDIAYVRYPDFLDVCKVGTEELSNDYLIPALDFMYKNNENTEWTRFQGFTDYEIGKFKRIVEALVWDLNKKGSNWLTQSKLARARFYAFVNEYDIRRGKNFLKTFPEMKNFYELCEEAHEPYINKDGDPEYYHINSDGDRAIQKRADAKEFYSKPIKAKSYSRANNE